MTYPTTCQRLRLGGTISGSTLSGGTSIETHGRNLLTWDGLMGWTGKRGSNTPLLGIDGARHSSGKPFRERLLSLAIVAYNEDDDGLVTLNSRMEHLEENIDEILALLNGNGEQIILERDLGDIDGSGGPSTRWIRCEALDSAQFIRGPVFGIPHASYGITVPLVAAYPFWQSETQHSTVVNGANDPVINGGNARDSMGVYVFAGDGSLTHPDGTEMTIAGSSAAVTVDVGAGTVIQSGQPAPGLLTPNKRYWFRLEPGTQLCDSTVSVTISHRDAFHS